MYVSIHPPQFQTHFADDLMVMPGISIRLIIVIIASVINRLQAPFQPIQSHLVSGACIMQRFSLIKSAFAASWAIFDFYASALSFLCPSMPWHTSGRFPALLGASPAP